MKLTFFISNIRDIYTKQSRSSESSMKVKVRSRWTFLVILLTSAVISKQRFFHGGEIVQYFQNYKCYGVERNHFKKYLHNCKRLMKKNKVAHFHIL